MNGILNLGNTCYFNSVLQLLLSCNNFINIIKNIQMIKILKLLIIL